MCSILIFKSNFFALGKVFFKCEGNFFITVMLSVENYNDVTINEQVYNASFK